MLAGLELREDLADEAGALRDDVVAVDGLEVLLAGEDEATVAKAGVGLGDPADHLADAVLYEARVAVRLLDDRDLVGALHQLVDLGAHGLLDDLQEVASVDVQVEVLWKPDVERSDAALIVGRDGDGREHAL